MRELLVHFSNKLFNVFCVFAIVHLTLSMYPIRVKKENDVDLNSIKHADLTSLQQMKDLLFKNISRNSFVVGNHETTISCVLTQTGQAFISYALRDAANHANNVDNQSVSNGNGSRFEITISSSLADSGEKYDDGSSGYLSQKVLPAKIDSKLTFELEDDLVALTLGHAAKLLLEYVVLGESNLLMKALSAIVPTDLKQDFAKNLTTTKTTAKIALQYDKHAGNFTASDVSNVFISMTTRDWMRTNNVTSPYRARQPTDRLSNAPSSYFADWYPDPFDDTSDCVDEWGHVWRYGFHSPSSVEHHCSPSVSRIWRDELGNTSPKGIRNLASTENPVLDTDHTSWVFNRSDGTFSGTPDRDNCSVAITASYPRENGAIKLRKSLPVSSSQQHLVNCTCLHPGNNSYHTQQTRRKLTDAWGNSWVYSAKDHLYHDYSLGHLALKSPSSLAARDRLGSYENPIIDPIEKLLFLYSERGVFHLRNDHFRTTKCFPGWIMQCLEKKEEREKKQFLDA